mgnify:CR=1 FL=1
MNKYNLVSKGIIYFLYYFGICTLVNSESYNVNNWMVTKGDPSAWDIEKEKLKCVSIDESGQWILSDNSVSSHWYIDAQIQSSNPDASKGILFTMDQKNNHGYYLSIKRKKLSLSKIVRSAKEKIIDDFENNLNQWKNFQGNPILENGKLVFEESFAENGTIEMLTRDFIYPSKDILAQVDIKEFKGTGGFQVHLDLTDGKNFVRIQRRGGAWGSNVRLFVNDGMRGWNSRPVDVSGQEFRLKISYERSSGIFTGYIDKLDGQGWATIATTAKSQVTFSTWTKIGFPISGGGTTVLPPNSMIIARVHAFGVNTYKIVLDSFTIGPDKLSNSKYSDSKIHIKDYKLIKSWPLKNYQNRNKLKILKTGGTYAFYVNDLIIGTVTNPSVETLEDFGNLNRNPEPDEGRYGFAFEGEGTHNVSKIRFKNIALAEKYHSNPVIYPRGPKGSWDDDMIHNSCIRKFDDKYYIYYTGRSNDPAKHSHNEGGRIGVAVSTDGFKFTPYKMNPIFDYIDSTSGNLGGNFQGGAVEQLNNGKYVLTFTMRNANRWRPIKYALGDSPLGPFYSSEKYIIIDTGNAKSFDSEHIHLHDIRRLDNGNYGMLYTGFSIAEEQKPLGDRGGLATSNDFQNWTKHLKNPVFLPGVPGSWDDGHVRPKGFVKYEQYYYMFYEGAHRSDQISYFFDQVGMARSKDLIEWERFPFNPILPIDAGDGRDKIVTQWPSAILTDTGIVVFYWGGGGGTVAISRADIKRKILLNWENQNQ